MMTDQELKKIQELWEKTGTFPRLLNEVERLQKILSKAGLCSFCGEELDSELKTGGMLTGASICYGCVEAKYDLTLLERN